MISAALLVTLGAAAARRAYERWPAMRARHEAVVRQYVADLVEAGSRVARHVRIASACSPLRSDRPGRRRGVRVGDRDEPRQQAARHVHLVPDHRELSRGTEGWWRGGERGVFVPRWWWSGGARSVWTLIRTLARGGRSRESGGESSGWNARAGGAAQGRALVARRKRPREGGAQGNDESTGTSSPPCCGSVARRHRNRAPPPLPALPQKLTFPQPSQRTNARRAQK